MVGCEHNVERVIIYPRPQERNKKLMITSGGAIRFVCPHGCEDVCLEVVGRDVRG